MALPGWPKDRHTAAQKHNPHPSPPGEGRLRHGRGSSSSGAHRSVLAEDGERVRAATTARDEGRVLTHGRREPARDTSDPPESRRWLKG
jgi:hypothetical protein